MGTIFRTNAQLNKQLQPAHIHLTLSQPEPLTGDGTNWYSPGTYVQAIDLPDNFNYIGGSIVYTGAQDIEVILMSTVSMESTSAGVGIEMAGGKNGVPDLNYVIPHTLTNANDEKELTNNTIVQMTAGDTLDFFVRASQDIVLTAAVWIAKNNE